MITDKQEALIEHLQDCGAPIECDDRGNPDFSYLDSVENADAYIKKYKHLYQPKSFASNKGFWVTKWDENPKG